MKKFLTVGATLLAGVTLAACSNSSSSTSSSTTSSAGQARKQPQQSPVTKKSASTTSSTDSSTTLSDPKIIGVLVYQEAFGSAPSPSDSLYFGTNDGNNNNGNNGQYIVSAGSNVGTISFSINGDQVTIYQMDHSAGESDAEARYTPTTVSLKDLINKYYKTASQKSNAQAVAASFQDANSSSDDSDQGDSDDNSQSDQPDDDTNDDDVDD